MSNTFVCHACSQKFQNGWSNEECIAEAIRLFGKVPDDAVTICDGCFKAMQAVGLIPKESE